MRLIPLTQDKFAMVDDEDYECLNQYNWFYQRINDLQYAARHNGTEYIYMHNAILSPAHGSVTDHRNLNGLDNRRSNLRTATHSQNHANQNKPRGIYSSQYKGVTWFKRDQCWRAQVTINYQNHHLGYFSCEADAALAYNEAAMSAWGKYARLNEVV